MCKTTKKDKMDVQEALDIMCKGIVSSKPTFMYAKKHLTKQKI